MDVKTVLITGAAGRIGYSLIPLVLSGSIFGQNTRITLKLLEIDMAKDKLEGIRMEIEDCNFSLLQDLVATVDTREAFTGVDVVILIGGLPRVPGMERKDLILKNAENIKGQAIALNEYASPDTKVLVVANPANTNCLVAIKSAPKIPSQNFSCLTRLDEERLRVICADIVGAKLAKKVRADDVRDVFIFGNHSTTQVAYLVTGYVAQPDGGKGELRELIPSEVEHQAILAKVQNRGAEVIKAQQLSSAMSAAAAISRHLADWLGPEAPSHSFSMGILANDNPYGIPSDIVFSYPCKRNRTLLGSENLIEIIPGLPIDHNIRELLDKSCNELMDERAQAEEILSSL